MMKKILIVGVMLLGGWSLMAGPEGFGDGDGDGMGDSRHSIWVSEMMGEDPNIVACKGGVFDMPATLKSIVSHINAANERGMTHAEFNGLVSELAYYMKDNPRYKKQTYVQLGNLYNHVKPSNMRNVDRAFQFYNMALPLAKEKSDIAQLYLMMASCFNAPGQEDIYQMTQYLMKAAEIDGRYASGIGDIVMCGWGSYCDIYLASVFYTIGMRNSDMGSTNKMYILKYTVENPTWTFNDSLGFYDFERYLYHSRINDDQDRAWAALLSSCQRGFVPGYYYAAYNYQNTRTNLSMSERRKGMFNWLSKGSKAGYSPCVVGLAQIAELYTIDTAKGDIYQPDENNQYKASDRKTCAKQAYELYKRAAAMMNTNAMFTLAERYRVGNEFGYPKADMDQALYWYAVCAQMGNSKALDRVRELKSEAVDRAAFAKQLDAAIEKANKTHVKSDGVQQKMFERILSSQKFSNPMMVNTTFNMNHPDIDIKNGNDMLLKSLLSDNYRNAYKLLSDKLAKIARFEKGYEMGNVPFYQERMRELRLRTESLGMEDEIRESMWETWDGE